MRPIALSQALPIATLAAAILFLGYGPDRSASIPLLIGYGVAFGAYVWTVKRVSFSWNALLILAIGLRLAIFLAPITWTDDHFRYIWDGLCTLNGISPFASTPAELIVNYPGSFPQLLLDRMNSPDYYSVYPPLSQALFVLSAYLGGGDPWRSTLALRAIIIAFDIAALLALSTLLRNDPMRIAKIALYALNPLVLLELTVNLHTEAFLIAPLLWANVLFERTRFDLSAMVLALVAAVKLWPLIFLAWIPSRLPWRSSLRYVAIVAALFALLWIPFWHADLLPHFFSSLRLFTEKLEFNGALFEGLRILVGDGAVKGTGFLPAVSVIALAIFTIVQWRRRTMPWPEMMLWSLGIYLLGSQAVHPWYILPLIALAVLTDYRWPILWSLLIVPTYLTYGSEPFTQPYAWIAIEYVLVIGYALFEIKRDIPHRTT